MQRQTTKIHKFRTMTKINDIIWLKEVESTNRYVRSHILELDNLSVVSAICQTSGKGQGDHTWHSEPGMNLTFSLLVKNPPIAPSEQGRISSDIADGIVSLLERHGIKAWIKPPNDIWVEDKKICGILIEHSLRGDRISWSIIGIGLNVNQTVFPEDLPNPTSMAIEGSPAEIQTVLEELLETFSTLSWLQ